MTVGSDAAGRALAGSAAEHSKAVAASSADDIGRGGKEAVGGFEPERTFDMENSGECCADICG